MHEKLPIFWYSSTPRVAYTLSGNQLLSQCLKHCKIDEWTTYLEAAPHAGLAKRAQWGWAGQRQVGGLETWAKRGPYGCQMICLRTLPRADPATSHLEDSSKLTIVLCSRTTLYAEGWPYTCSGQWTSMRAWDAVKLKCASGGVVRSPLLDEDWGDGSGNWIIWMLCCDNIGV